MTSSQLSPLKKKDPLWTFCHYSGCGNFFLIAYDPDNVHTMLSPSERASLALNPLAPKEVDGLLFLGIEHDTMRMRYYNKDGSHASMCGNGLRCLGHFIFSNHLSECPTSTFVQTDVGRRTLQLLSNTLIKTDMGQLQDIQIIQLNGKTLFLTNTGVPHALFVLPTLPTGAIEEDARLYRFHPALGKEGANISYATYTHTDIHLRTYERGVEKETGACGTGACAAASILHKHFGLSLPCSVVFTSKETATIDIQNNRLFLTASCKKKGTYDLHNPMET